MIEPLNNIGIEEMCPNIIEGIYDKPTANILNDEKLNTFPLRLGKRQGCSLSSLLFSIALEILARGIRQEKNKRHPNWKGRSKIVFADDIVLYIENSEDSIRKLLELISKFS